MGILILSFKKQFYSIRASSPTFILLMLVGSLIMYGGALSWTMWMNQFLCIAKNWFLGLGFVLLFGTLVAKTHRIKKIFLFKTLTVKIISDGQLYMIVGVFVLIEIAINACWTIFTLPNSIEIIVDENRPVYNYYTCTTSDLDSIFLIVSLVYKGLLVLYSLYLSTLLWKHKKSALIESREIIFCIYNLTIFGAIFAAVQASLESTTSRSLLFLLRSSCILFSTFVTVATLTMPKLIKPERGSNYNYNTRKNETSTGTESKTKTGLSRTPYMRKYMKLKKATKSLLELYPGTEFNFSFTSESSSTSESDHAPSGTSTGLSSSE
eukprot:TRINITY_DN766_c0_g1_i1.p1 TRINITY_DN766_c0_g1~~TRINITY_DN766_c0_g1_i1.p1  ORF type:complete len:323 (-),score=32.21 TRINITY_DN766_c0_g1_i1:21-989(-)